MISHSLVRLTCLFVLFLRGLLPAQDQTCVLRGKIVDGFGEQLIGCVVVIPSQNDGVLTNFDGNYELRFEFPGDTILIEYRYIGFRTQRIVFKRKQFKPGIVLVRNITLEEQGSYPRLPNLIIDAWRAEGFASEMDILAPYRLREGAGFSTERALNTVPGVRFDSRGPGGSRRLSIRGSVIRSPFGVQNVRAYFDGAPLTSPDGSTPLEVVDVANVKQLTVEKGPMGAEFGPGNGGVLQIQPNLTAVARRLGASVEFTAGSYGYLRMVAGSGFNSGQNDRTRIAVRYLRQSYAGYRDQEANEKQMLFLGLRQRLGRDRQHELRFTGWYHEGIWELPGALTIAEADSAPRQALPFSVDAQARVERRNLRGNLGYRYLRETVEITAQAYFTHTDKLNPFGTSPFFQGYKDEAIHGFGTRVTSKVQLVSQSGGLQLHLRGGGEVQWETNQALEYDNQQGEPGDLRFDQDLQARQAHGFVAFRGQLRQHALAASASLNAVNYNVQDLLRANALDLSARRRFRPGVRPALMYELKNDAMPPYRLRARLSTSYSPPSLAELRRDDGTILPDLLSERAWSLEVRPSAMFLNRQLTAELNGYLMQVRNAILPQQLNTTEVVYQNAGQTQQNGLEWMLRYQKGGLTQDAVRRIFSVEFKGALQDYRFSRYVKDATDLAGNFIPGVPRATLTGRIEKHIWRGIDATVLANYNGRTFADDANAVAQDGYWLLNFELGRGWASYRPNLLGGPVIRVDPPSAFRARVFAGINNLLDTQYTNFLALNAFGGRYWNPAPGRNFYAGVRIFM
ncbi:MAG: TonB-dependent receptor plug domain-containing protein [Bacteroidota bacterium]